MHFRIYLPLRKTLLADGLGLFWRGSLSVDMTTRQTGLGRRKYGLQQEGVF
jgi:hypothetical protein